MAKKVVKKSSKSAPKAGGGLKKAVSAGVGLLSGGTSKKGAGGKRRSHGVQWYANAVLKAKLKKKLNRIKYGSI